MTGERNGISSLGAFLARMIVAAPEYVKGKYDLHRLKEIENMVAEAVHSKFLCIYAGINVLTIWLVNVPFNNPITGFCAFTHKVRPHSYQSFINVYVLTLLFRPVSTARQS